MKKILILIMALIPLIINAQTTNNKISLLKVQGEFITKQVPENINVSLSITENDTDYQECFSKAFETLKNLKSVFINNDIDEKSIKTRDLLVREEYSWESNKKSKKGYVATIELEIEEKYTEEFANNLLKSLGEYTFEVNYMIRFVLSDKQKETLRELAIKEAIKDATRKAEVIAETSKVKLGDIYKITYGQDLNNIYGSMNYEMVLEDEIIPITRPTKMGGVDLNPKEISLQKTILIEWEILNN